MTDSLVPSGTDPVPGAPAQPTRVRRTPATAVGAFAAVALGAGVLLLPSPGAAGADALATRALTQQPAHAAQLTHPVQPVEPPATGAEQTAVPPARDPFRPLITDAGAQTTVPVPTTDGSASSDDPPVAPAPEAPATGQYGPPVPTAPHVPNDAATSVAGRKLVLVAVEPAGDGFTAVLSLDGSRIRAEAGAGFGPDGRLRLLSLQEGPGERQWTAVVQLGQGQPFDLVTGKPIRLP